MNTYIYALQKPILIHGKEKMSDLNQKTSLFTIASRI